MTWREGVASAGMVCRVAPRVPHQVRDTGEIWVGVTEHMNVAPDLIRGPLAARQRAKRLRLLCVGRRVGSRFRGNGVFCGGEE